MKQKKQKPGKRVGKALADPLTRQRIRSLAVALLLFGVMVSSAFWGVIRLQDPAVLPLKVVRIDGRFRYLDRADIVRSVGDAVQGNFFTVDVEAVRNAARQLPWVDHVSVRRRWPDMLDIKVEGQQPLARWGRKRLVNRRGEVFAPPPASIPDGLPALSGPDGSAVKVVERYQEISHRLSRLGLQVESLDLNSRQAWRLQLKGGLELKLGRSDVALRLGRFIRVYPRLGKEPGRRLKRVDLRYTNGFTVAWESIQPAQGSDLKQLPTGRRSGGSVRQQRGRV